MYVWFYQSYQMLAPNIQVFKQPGDLRDLNPGLRECFASLKLTKKIAADHCCDKRASGSSLTVCGFSAASRAYQYFAFFLWPASNSAHNSASYCLLHKHRGSHAAWPSPHTHTHVHTRTHTHARTHTFPSTTCTGMLRLGGLLSAEGIWVR